MQEIAMKPRTVACRCKAPSSPRRPLTWLVQRLRRQLLVLHAADLLRGVVQRVAERLSKLLRNLRQAG